MIKSIKLNNLVTIPKKIYNTIFYRGIFPSIGIFLVSFFLKHFNVLFSFESFIKIRALFMLGYWINVKQPKTFNEKILNRKIFGDINYQIPLIADKWKCRSYIKQAGFEYILNELYYITDNPNNIPFDILPNKFVIKANYGSNRNIIVTDKNLNPSF